MWILWWIHKVLVFWLVIFYGSIKFLQKIEKEPLIHVKRSMKFESRFFQQIWNLNQSPIDLTKINEIWIKILHTTGSNTKTQKKKPDPTQKHKKETGSNTTWSGQRGRRREAAGELRERRRVEGGGRWAPAGCGRRAGPGRQNMGPCAKV
jgi:hypothetical protein